MHSLCLRPQRFTCVQPTSHISFWIPLNFASGLLWQRSGYPILLVARELKLCFWESKILTIACVQALGDSFFQIHFIFGA